MNRVVLDNFSNGMNNVLNPYLLPEGVLADIVNYEYGLDGRLKLRKKTEVFSDLKGIADKIISLALWYPNRKALGMAGDVIYIVQTYDGNHDKIAAYYDAGAGVKEQLVIHEHVPHGKKASYYVSARRVIVADGTHNVRQLYITIDDDMKSSVMGLPAPLEMPLISSADTYNDYVPVDTDDIGMGIERGNIIQYCYTVEDKYGTESNPSPIVTLEHMRVKYLTADNILGYKYYHKRATLTQLRLLQPEFEKGLVKYYNIYRRDVPYRSETIGTQFTMVKQVSITDPGNLISVFDQSRVGTEPIQYDRNVAPIAHTITGIDNIIFGAVSKTPDKAFPFIFDEFLEIKLTNEDSRDYLNGYVAIAVPLKKAGEWDFSAIVNLLDSEHRSSCIRLFHEDMITPCQTYYRTGVRGEIPYLYLLTKVPEIKMMGETLIYLCMVTEPGVGKGCTGTWALDNDIGFHRGVFMQGGKDSIMFVDSVPQNSRELMCMDTMLSYHGGEEISTQCEDTGISFYFPNRANNTSKARFYLPTVWHYNNDEDGQYAKSFSQLNLPNPTYDKWEPFGDGETGGRVDYYIIFATPPGGTIPRPEPAVATINARGTLLIYLDMCYEVFASIPVTPTIVGLNDVFSIDEMDYHEPDTYDADILEYDNNADSRYRLKVFRPALEGNIIIVGVTVGSSEIIHNVSVDLSALNLNKPLRFRIILCGKSWYLRITDYSGLSIDKHVINTETNISNVQHLVFGEGASAIARHLALHGSNTYKAPGFHRVVVYEQENHIVTEDSMRERLEAISHRVTQYNNRIGGNPASAPSFWNNKNISFERRRFNEDLKEYQIRWSDQSGENFPPMNYLQVNEPVLAVLGMPSFLKFQYQNTLLYMTRNSIKRIVLGDDFMSLAQKPEDVIEEHAAYGLYSPGSLAEISQGIIWLSEAGVMLWTAEGMMNISAGILDLNFEGRPNDFTGSFFPDRYQYWLYDKLYKVCYVYHLNGSKWTRFTGLDARVMANLNRGENFENKLILIGDDVELYPGKQTLDKRRAKIVTAQYRTEHSKPIRARFLWEGAQPDRVEAYTYNELLDGADLKTTFEPPDLPRFRWMNFPIGFWGEYLQFSLHGFDDLVRLELDFKETV